MINKFIRNFIAKQMAGRSDDGIMITLKDPQRVTLGENILADTLMRYGIDPAAITSEAQLKTILQQIKNAQAAEIREAGIRNTESAKVFDLKGKRIKDTDNIMGGEEMPPPGSRGGPDDIAAPVQSSEETLKNMIMAENKKNIAKMRQKKMLDEAIEDASPGFSGDRKVDAELVAENLAERMGLVYDDLPTKQRLDIYDQAYTGLSKRRQMQRESLEDFVEDAGGVDESDPRGIDDFIPDPEDMAKGGRVGFRIGSESGKDTSGREYASDTAASKAVATSPSRDDGPPGGDNNQPPSQKIKLPEPVKTGIDTYNNLKYLQNLYKMNPQGIMFDVGKQILFNKLFSEADTEQDPNMMLTELSTPQLEFLNSPKIQRDLKEFGREPKAIFDQLPDYEERRPTILNPFKKQEPTTPEEFNEYLDSIGVKRMTAADGGIMRLGFKDGMNRRTFLKLFTGLVSLPIIGKIVKPLKVGKKVTQVPIIKTDNVAGKPEWFDQLVNKVILEGDEVTKRFATKDREIVHMKKLDDDTNVMVTQDLDEGAVRVEYQSLDNMYEDPVQLRYKKPNPDEGDPRPAAEFDVAESGPVGRADGPDDYSIDIDEVGGTSISDLTSDVSKLKEYATGQKPTLKEFIQSKKRKDKARRITEGGEAEMDAVIKRQGEFIENDLVDLDPGDFASGGIARMLGE